MGMGDIQIFAQSKNVNFYSLGCLIQNVCTYKEIANRSICDNTEWPWLVVTSVIVIKILPIYPDSAVA